MGTTDRSVNKQAGKIPESITEKAKKENIKKGSGLSLKAIMMALGMNYHRIGRGSKRVDITKAYDKSYKKKRRRLEKQGRKASRK